MNIKKLLLFIFVELILCAVILLVIWNVLEGNQSLRDNLTAEIIGGGILGTIVAGMFFYLQEAGEYQTSKKKAISFYEDKLTLDINEVFDRSPSAFNFSGMHKFYFDGSRVNALFDVYLSNFKEINDYVAYYPQNSLVSCFNLFYKETRKGYVLAEKLEGLIYQIVRSEHHKRQLIDANDFSARSYIKAHLFTDMPDSDIVRYLDLQSVPDRMKEIVTVVKNHGQIMELLAEVKEARKNLLKRENEIEKLLRNIQEARIEY